MTLEEMNAARDAATREALLEGGVIARAQALLSDIVPLGAVGASAGHVETTLKHFVAEATGFLNRTAPSDAAPPPPEVVAQAAPHIGQRAGELNADAPAP